MLKTSAARDVESGYHCGFALRYSHQNPSAKLPRAKLMSKISDALGNETGSHCMVCPSGRLRDLNINTIITAMPKQMAADTMVAIPTMMLLSNANRCSSASDDTRSKGKAQ